MSSLAIFARLLVLIPAACISCNPLRLAPASPHKPKVTIDLKEYQYLLSKIEEKSEELDYDEAYSELIYNLNYGNKVEEINRSNPKYEFSKIENPISGTIQFKVRLKKK